MMRQKEQKKQQETEERDGKEKQLERKINIRWRVSQCVHFDVVNELCSRRRPNTLQKKYEKRTNLLIYRSQLCD